MINELKKAILVGIGTATTAYEKQIPLYKIWLLRGK